MRKLAWGLGFSGLALALGTALGVGARVDEAKCRATGGGRTNARAVDARRAAEPSGRQRSPFLRRGRTGRRNRGRHDCAGRPESSAADRHINLRRDRSGGWFRRPHGARRRGAATRECARGRMCRMGPPATVRCWRRVRRPYRSLPPWPTKAWLTARGRRRRAAGRGGADTPGRQTVTLRKRVIRPG